MGEPAWNTRGTLDWLRNLLLPEGYPFFRRLGMMVALLLFYMGGYLGIAHYNLHRPYYYDVSLRLDSMIPFIPQAMPLYALVYFMAGIIYIAAPDFASLKKAAKGIFLISLVCFVFFVVLPVKAMHRPPITADGSLTTDIVMFFYWLDAPVNLFPSMHVASAFLIAWTCGTFNRILGVVCRVLAWTILVCVLVVKQHYVADVMAGLVVGYAVYWYLYVYERIEYPEWVPALIETLRRYTPRFPRR